MQTEKESLWLIVSHGKMQNQKNVISRLHEAFESSALEYSKLNLKVWAAILKILQVFNIIFQITSGDVLLFDINAYPNCTLSPSCGISITLLDITTTILYLYPFIKSMYYVFLPWCQICIPYIWYVIHHHNLYFKN